MAPDKDLERLFESVAGFFGLLSEPARLKILNALCDGERSVGEVVQSVASTQTSVSRHLNLMYAKGLKRRRNGQQTFYSVADPRPWNCVGPCVCTLQAWPTDSRLAAGPCGGSCRTRKPPAVTERQQTTGERKECRIRSSRPGGESSRRRRTM
jgi:DNA-binding transcriptional ArsR family regulator